MTGIEKIHIIIFACCIAAASYVKYQLQFVVIVKDVAKGCRLAAHKGRAGECYIRASEKYTTIIG